VTSERRRWRSSFFDMSCRCSGVRSLARARTRPIAPCWRRSVRCYRVHGGGRFSFGRRRSCAGIGSSSAAAGQFPAGRRAGRPWPRRRADSSCAWRRRTRAGGTRPDPRRAGRPRHLGIPQQRLERAPPPRHRAGAEASELELESVPPPAGGRDRRV
jgi:hypothetical protein